MCTWVPTYDTVCTSYDTYVGIIMSSYMNMRASDCVMVCCAVCIAFSSLDVQPSTPSLTLISFRSNTAISSGVSHPIPTRQFWIQRRLRFVLSKRDQLQLMLGDGISSFIVRCMYV